MSDLREKIVAIIEANIQQLPSMDIGEFTDVDTEEASDQILAAFKAHIEGCERPENPHDPVGLYGESWQKKSYDNAIEADRKALMESLKKKKGAK